MCFAHCLLFQRISNGHSLLPRSVRTLDLATPAPALALANPAKPEPFGVLWPQVSLEMRTAP